MPISGASAYANARVVTAIVRSLLNDANINGSLPIFLASIARAGNVATAVSVGPHGLVPGDQVTIVGVTSVTTNFNGVFTVALTPGPNSFTYAQTGATESGTVTNGTMANVGQGALWTDGIVLPYVNAAYRKVRRALENVGQPGPIVDDFLLVVAAISQADPSVQVSISDATAPPNQLPVNLVVPLKLWERPNGTTQEFSEMTDMTNSGGLPSQVQDTTLHMWEWAGDQINFIGATQDTQIRMRYRAYYADLTSGTSQLLLRDSQDAVAYAAAGLAAQSRGAPTAGQWDQLFTDALEDLIVRATRQDQRRGKRRRPFSARSGWGPF